jgi:DNA-directed RNA polymerase specialized sigma24 family protein
LVEAGDVRDAKGGAAAKPDEQIPTVPPPFLSQASFLASVRIGQVIALRQLFLFYSPLLRDHARQLGVSPDERDALVATVLDDVVMQLQDSELIPRDLASYLVGSLRNSVRKTRRTDMRREQRYDDAYTRMPHGRERIVAECHSQYSVREAAGDVGDVAPMGVVIAKLAAATTAALNELETRLMVGISRNMPLRDLAEQAGITYGAARVRVHRLRERLVPVAAKLREALPPNEQHQLDRLFRRAGIALTRPSRSTPPSAGRVGSLTPNETTDDNT